MKTKLILGCLALVVGTGYGVAALAQAKPDVLVKQRQAAMTLQGKYFGPLAGMASGKLPYNAEVVARNARELKIQMIAPRKFRGERQRRARLKHLIGLKAARHDRQRVERR